MNTKFNFLSLHYLAPLLPKFDFLFLLLEIKKKKKKKILFYFITFFFYIKLIALLSLILFQGFHLSPTRDILKHIMIPVKFLDSNLYNFIQCIIHLPLTRFRILFFDYLTSYGDVICVKNNLRLNFPMSFTLFCMSIYPAVQLKCDLLPRILQSGARKSIHEGIP